MLRFTSGIAVLFTGILLFSLSCGPKPEKIEPEEEKAPLLEINDFTVSTNDGAAELLWNINRQEGELFGGYDIFMIPVGGETEGLIEPLNETRYPGDTDADPTRESFETVAPRPGVIYKTWIWIYSAEGDNYYSSDTLLYSPVYEGEIVLNLRWSVRTSSYNFSDRRYVPARSLDSDIMIMSGKSGAKIYSPNNLNDDFRTTRFTSPESRYEEIKLFNPESYNWHESLQLHAGGTYLFRTAEGRYGKLKCTRMDGEGGRLQATFSYNYIPAERYYKFL